MPTPLEPGVPLEGDAIPLSVPEIRGNEWQYVRECLDTGWVSSVGAYVNRFKRADGRVRQLPRAVAVVNGTAECTWRCGSRESSPAMRCSFPT